MTLRVKTLAVVGLTIAVLCAAVFAVLTWRLTSEFETLERDDARHVANRLHYVFAEEQRRLATLAADLAIRGSTYDFARGIRPDFPSTHLTDDVLTNMQTSFLVFIDADGRLVHAEFTDLDLGTRAEADSATVDAVLSTRHLQRPGDPRASVKGVIRTSRGLAIVAAHAITTPDLYAPPSGTLVVGRYLDAGELEHLTELVGSPVSLVAIEDARVQPVVSSALVSTVSTAIAAPRDERTMDVWLTLVDLGGRGAGALRTVQEREVRAHGVGALRYLALSLLLVGLGAGASVLVTLDRTVLSRLSRLSKELGMVTANRDPSFRVWESGGDELAEVAHDVNLMLAALAEVERELHGATEGLEERVRQRTGELAASRARYRRLIDGMADAVISVRHDATIAFVNERVAELTGLLPAELPGASLYRLMTRPSAEEVRRRMDEGLAPDTVWTAEVEFVRPDGGTVPVELHASALLDERGEVTGVQFIGHDVSERSRHERQLVHLASHDHLTGLHNRRFFETALEVELGEIRRDGGSGSVLWLDIDDFKDVNDTLGHRTGDEVLCAIAERLGAQVRESSVLARMGGDEFAILVPEVSAEEASVAAARVLASVNSMVHVSGEHSIRISASMGVVMFPEHGATVAEVLSNADLAMYDAKAGGRSRLHVFRQDERRQADLRARVMWNERITQALREERFVLFAQPVLDVRSGAIARHELLIRMRDDDGALIPPAEFLPSAERLGLVRDIDRWVVEQGAALLSRHADVDLSLEINLSGNVLGDAGLLAEIEAVVRAAGVPAERFGFEITETAAIADISRARTFIGTLADLGCRFSLDDFGSGFSSFYYLKHLPIDCLKVDGSFIRGLARNEQDRHLVRGIVELCRALNVQVAAEYVETAEILRIVEELGIDYAQGYEVARPMPVEEALGAYVAARTRGKAG